MWMYSLIWTNRNVRPSRKVDTIPAFSPNRLPLRTDMSAQCRVSDEDSRMAVLTPGHRLGHLGAGRRPGVVVDDADEEVRGEERAEDHDLGDDEKQHPERRRLHARGAVRGRRSVVLVLGVGDRRRLPCAAPRRWARPFRVDHVLDRLARGARTRSIRSERSQPDFVSANVEITMSSTRKYCSALVIAVNGSGSPTIPAASARGRAGGRARASAASGRAGRRCPGPPSGGHDTMNSGRDRAA